MSEMAGSANTPVYFIYVLGMGGWSLDPGGALMINRRVHQLPGVIVVPPFDPKNITQVPQYINKLPANAIIIYASDSCGSNLFGWVQQSCPTRSFAAACLIQASLYCGKHPIQKNCPNVELFYTNFLELPLPGLGSYKIPPAVWAPTNPKLVKYPGRYLTNNGKTLINYIYAPGPHPGDDQTGIQACIMARIKQVQADAAHGLSAEQMVPKAGAEYVPPAR